ncbi:MAG: 50S ribosomal protein L25 [Candidatus Peribacteraceae bacterium]|jgi:large subunit ribosomal protein L25|nr:50S ribosomal protein L25 [Candidatus Peribacteraceae bacterium]HCI03646.1 50S ribosomal protein L25 [Candidatus Peribacteria bacterium]|tara:strand:+ start:7326 stop:8024 length:699 start_codon:yes stop_codon:yes gene_type:complete
MDNIQLTATVRKPDIKANFLRKEGNVPCVLYGNDVDNTSLICTHKDVLKAYAKAGKSTLVDLDAGGKKIPVLFHSLDFDPVTDNIIHADFYAVDMKKEIEAEVPIKFEGEAPAVKELGGIFFVPRDQVKVKCLPTNLPHELVASVETLVEFGDALHVSVIQVPDGVTILDDQDAVIATVQEPRKEEVVEVAPAEGEEGEAVEGETAEGAEGEKAEGEAQEGKDESATKEGEK